MKTSDLRFALNLAQPCIVGIDLIPVLQHFCFEAEKSRLFAYDEVCAIVVGLDTDLHCALRGETLLALLETAGAEVTLEPTSDAKVELRSGKLRAELPALPPGHFVFEEPRARDRSTLTLSLGKEVLAGLARCADGVSTDPRSVERTAVVMCTGKSASLYACDGTSLVKVVLRKGLGDEDRQVLLPKSVCDDVVGLSKKLSGKEGSTEATMYLSSRHVLVEFAQDEAAVKEVGKWNVKLIGVLIAGDPKVDEYEELLANVTKGSPVAVDDEFQPAVARVAAVVAEDVEKRCKLTINGKGLTVEGEGKLGAAVTTVAAMTSKHAVEAEVDPERLARYKDVITHMVLDKERIVMYDNEREAKASFVFVTACF